MLKDLQLYTVLKLLKIDRSLISEIKLLVDEQGVEGKSI